MTLWLLGYPAQAVAHIHDALALAHTLSHPYSLVWARCWVAIISQLRRDVSAVVVPCFYTLLVDVCDHLSHPDDGLQALAEAHTLVEQHEERWWEAEVCRLQGVLLLRQSGRPQAEAETWLQRALDVARRQEAKSLELRAAMSLSRLWQQQGKRQAAHDLLAPIYGWFTEGFDTADLQEAKALVDELT